MRSSMLSVAAAGGVQPQDEPPNRLTQEAWPLFELTFFAAVLLCCALYSE